MQIADLLNLGTEELHTAGVSDPELDARLLLEHCTGKGRSEIFLDGAKKVSQQEQSLFLQLLMRRKGREPLAYILGEQEFWSLPFQVSRDVLIPRPETEFLLDRVLALCSPANIERGRILDLCCGSGVIATVLGRETGRSILALDISHKALMVTRSNARRHCPEPPVELVQGDLLTPFQERASFSLIVSNPPYVSSVELAGGLMPEVVDYEPHLALDGGMDGLLLIQRIRALLAMVLLPGGQFFMEIGADQGRAVEDLFQTYGSEQPDFQQVEILKDYAGRDRVLHVRRAK